MQIDFSHQNWLQIAAWAEAEMERLRKKNDDIELDPVATSGLRGEIRVLKRLLALPEVAHRDASFHTFD